MFGSGLESHQTSVISSLTSFRTETTIVTTCCVSGDQEGGDCNLQNPLMIVKNFWENWLPEDAMNGNRQNALALWLL